jgi:hypothetical protein
MRSLHDFAISGMPQLSAEGGEPAYNPAAIQRQRIVEKFGHAICGKRNLV